MLFPDGKVAIEGREIVSRYGVVLACSDAEGVIKSEYVVQGTR
jgi:hypothetical protein